MPQPLKTKHSTDKTNERGKGVPDKLFKAGLIETPTPEAAAEHFSKNLANLNGPGEFPRTVMPQAADSGSPDGYATTPDAAAAGEINYLSPTQTDIQETRNLLKISKERLQQIIKEELANRTEKIMKASELKANFKPLIKECIKEVIFEEGILSGLITEVAQGLGNVSQRIQPEPQVVKANPGPNPRIVEAKKQLHEVKAQLQKATGMQGIFEGTTALASPSPGRNSQYGALRDKDPGDAGVNIDGLINMTGGWSHLT